MCTRVHIEIDAKMSGGRTISAKGSCRAGTKGKSAEECMTKRARRRAWLAALWGAAFGLGFGCHDDGGSSSQVLTGRIDTTGVVAIRAVSGTDVVTAAQVGSDGSFRIALPVGARYRLEVLTASGVRQVLAHQDGTWKGLELKVCVPSDPFDLGTVGDSGTMCDPSDPNCQPGCGDPPPPPCSDPMDPDCKCSDPMDPNCQPPPPPTCGGPNEPPCPDEPCADPMDPNCKPPPCMDPMDPNCQPPSCGGPNEPPCPDDPCMDPTDPNCKPPEPCTDPMDPNCMGCWPGDPSCGGTTDPVCEDPMDPQTCKDPCVIDPMQCGCAPTEPNCWPPPEPPMCMGENDDTMCDPGDTVTPSNVPGDFGCMGLLDK